MNHQSCHCPKDNQSSFSPEVTHISSRSTGLLQPGFFLLELLAWTVKEDPDPSSRSLSLADPAAQGKPVEGSLHPHRHPGALGAAKKGNSGPPVSYRLPLSSKFTLQYMLCSTGERSLRHFSFIVSIMLSLSRRCWVESTLQEKGASRDRVGGHPEHAISSNLTAPAQHSNHLPTALQECTPGFPQTSRYTPGLLPMLPLVPSTHCLPTSCLHQ